MEQGTLSLTSVPGDPTHVAGSTQIAHISSITTPTPRKLPSEMLAAVFEAGARVTLQDGGLPFLIVVSHVCRHWRTAAYSFPYAWWYIPIHLQRDTMTDLFLSRSQGHLLDVCLYLGENATIDAIKDALKLVAPSTPRWTRLCIRARAAVDVLQAQEHLRTLQDMTSLQAFELRVDVHTTDDEGQPADLLKTPLPPKLATVACAGMPLGYLSPAMRGLTHLTLENLMRPSYMVFCELCLQNPRLEYLRLVNASPPPTWSYRGGGVDWRGNFVLPSLRTLDLVYEHDDYDEVYVVQFFIALSVPSLQELSFQTNWRSTWEGFERTWCCTTGVVPQTKLFQGLRILRLVLSRPIPFHYTEITRYTFDSFPQLEELAFHASDDRAALHLLRGWMGKGYHNPLPCHEIWPRVKLLSVWAPFDDNETKDLEDTAKGLLDLLESLRLSTGQPFEVRRKSISTKLAPLGRPSQAYDQRDP